ncbi:MAG: superoxide dismutase family protein [Clostridia bacterium]|nr:superoxide dismutase family protein [Clostridia bacterium]
MLQRLPNAVAVISGSAENSEIHGTVKFYQAAGGVFTVADIFGLPVSTEACKGNIFAFHIHGGSDCSGNQDDPFADAGSHYNPNDCPHPYHAGDMPPLFGAGGRAFLAFLTDRFDVNEIVGKTVIIHDGVDDFTTQPSGNAGNKIACGVISKVRR